MFPTHQQPVQFNRPQQPRGADDQLLTIEQVYELTGICVNTLRWMRHVGKGPRSFRLGRRVMYWLSDVLAWIDEQYESDRPGPRPTTSIVS